MNVFTFTGNLGRDCRTNTVGQSFVCNFAVAVTEGYGDRKRTHWVDCALWGKQAEAFAPYLVKGQQVAVSGEFGMKEASDKYPASPTCRVQSISLVGGKREAAPETGHERQQRKAADTPKPAADFDDGFDLDIPF